MAKPDIDEKSNSTPGEWKALLAPMQMTAAKPEDIDFYLVVTVNQAGDVELRTNMPDGMLRPLLRQIAPG